MELVITLVVGIVAGFFLSWFALGRSKGVSRDQYEGLLKEKTDLYNKVLELTKNFRDMTVMAVLLSLSSVSKLGRWTLDTAPNYASANAIQRLEQGFWCDASGNASPGDDTSAISHWW